MPKIHEIPITNKITKYITKDIFEQICPYAKASSVFTNDGMSFWTFEAFIEAIEFMNNLSNPMYHNFGTDSTHLNNIIEIASFLANFSQETGDLSLEAPYPWSWPKIVKSGNSTEGLAGGGIGILEGAVPNVFFGETNTSGELTGKKINLSTTEKKVLGVSENTIQGVIMNLSTMNQPQFGLGVGTGNGAVFMKDLIAVSDDGTLWGDIPDNERNSNLGFIKPIKDYKFDYANQSNRMYAALSPIAQYSGRGAIQLSYNYNYTECSKALFGDYRLVKYPNLIITQDRENFLGKPFYFGFPGPNTNGNNKLPDFISKTTPNARVMAWLVCFWFWMDTNRSGRKISCHYAMTRPFTHGITSCNMIINNQSGCSTSWASKKNECYKRICKIFGLSDEIIMKSIICPPHPESQIK